MSKLHRHHKPASQTPLLLRLLPLILLLLILAGAQGAFACQQPLTGSRLTTPIGVTGCHINIIPEAVAPCCNSATCHRSSVPLRHLGNPEFANQIKDMQPALTESRQTSPQPRTNISYTLINYPSQPSRQITAATSSTVPRLALSILKTTVLLH